MDGAVTLNTENKDELVTTDAAKKRDPVTPNTEKKGDPVTLDADKQCSPVTQDADKPDNFVSPSFSTLSLSYLSLRYQEGLTMADPDLYCVLTITI